jgi:hypothetical protein
METEDKLNEAKYFLKMMEINQGDIQKFKYNFSAFLSASRSVTFYLKKEFKRYPTFDQRYSEIQEKMRSDALLKFFKDTRNYVIKEETKPTKRLIEVKIRKGILLKDNASFKVELENRDTIDLGTGHKENNLPKTTEIKRGFKKTKIDTTVTHFFEEYPETNVLSLCRDYLIKLSEIIREAKHIVKND